MREIIFDIETNGFLEDLTKVHCIALIDGGDVQSFNGAAIEDALAMLEQADVLVGHNIQKFDLKALKKVYPHFTPKGKVRDTLVCSRLVWPEIIAQDYALLRTNPDFPTKLLGSHSLEAWGHRLGIRKGDFGKVEDANEKVWDTWSQAMEDYCKQDVAVTQRLWNVIKSKGYSEESIQLEHEFAAIIHEQELEGFPFDEKAAADFYIELCAQRAEIDKQIMPYFPPWKTYSTFTPKVNNSKRGYVKGVPFTKVKEHTFNPSSDKQMIDRLKEQRKWEPVDFTEKGSPKIDGETLRRLGKEWPECNLLADRADIEKIIGMLAEGDNAWLKLVKNGRIHGAVITNGAVTGRCAHFKPNLGQIPKEGEMGSRCRKLFTTIPGYSLVGWDASGLELRMLASYMGKFDGGAYVLIVTQGDVHTENQKAAGLPTRGNAKTFIYAFLYGAGGHKIGLIVGVKDEEIPELKKLGLWNQAKSTLERRNMSTSDVNVALEVKGRMLKAKFIKGLPALGMLKEAVETKAKTQGFIKGIDGRLIPTRSPHSALNTLLQSAGAITVKLATIIWHNKLREHGLSDKVRQVVHVHDEVQCLVKEGYEEQVGQLAKQSIREAGERFKLRCPLDGEFKIGRNWHDTH
jgi:DNA polymerase I-like protein with 3'-5' exonuclease and polymerase domains